jgi:hypothetical protein
MGSPPHPLPPAPRPALCERPPWRALSTVRPRGARTGNIHCVRPASLFPCCSGLGSLATSESPSGTFTVAATIPIAIVMGICMRFIRPGRIGEASVFGVLT